MIPEKSIPTLKHGREERKRIGKGIGPRANRMDKKLEAERDLGARK